MTANIQFNVAVNAKTWLSDIFCYLLCYDKDMNILSSNYYDSNTADRGDQANLTVSNGCYIFCVMADYSLNPVRYYTAQIMSVSDITSLPQSGIIDINFYRDSDSSNIISPYDLSTIGLIYAESPSDYVIKISLYLMQDVTKYVIPITNDNYEVCNNPGSVIIGDMATAIQAQDVGTFYNRDNICMPRKIPEYYFNQANQFNTDNTDNSEDIKLAAKNKITTGISKYEANNNLNNSDSNVSWLLIILIVILAIVIIVGIIYAVKHHQTRNI